MSSTFLNGLIAQSFIDKKYKQKLLSKEYTDSTNNIVFQIFVSDKNIIL